MRKIKFRGMTTENKFVYGLLARIDAEKNTAVIFSPEENREYNVDLESVGECTGNRDDHGAEIFEGDIVSFEDYDKFAAEIFFDNGQYMVFFHGSYRSFQDILENFRNITVIGNVHENPELLDEYN